MYNGGTSSSLPAETMNIYFPFFIYLHTDLNIDFKMPQ